MYPDPSTRKTWSPGLTAADFDAASMGGSDRRIGNPNYHRAGAGATHAAAWRGRTWAATARIASAIGPLVSPAGGRAGAIDANCRENVMRVAMIGTGYVGLVSGACFADFGHTVICVDKDATRIARLCKGDMPIFEPGLTRLVAAQM